MRIRSIRPEFWSSEDVAALDWHTRLVFIGLWSYVDDNGVGRDNERLITASLFPLDDPLSESSVRIHGALKALETAGLITRYSVDGRNYLHVTTFETHQRVNRPSPSRYPLPTCENATTHDTLTEDSVSPQRTFSAGEGEKGRRGEGEKVSLVHPPATRTNERTTPDRFDDFWSMYPRKQGKQAALKAWVKALRTVTEDEILTGLAAQLPYLEARHTDKAGDFCPHASTWLNGGRWADEVATPTVDPDLRRWGYT